MKFNTIEEAIEDIKNGKMVIVVDDEDRETKVILLLQLAMLHQKLSIYSEEGGD
jgi:3,4-dihydroxy-2-butanone 4-phosphate synthase